MDVQYQFEPEEVSRPDIETIQNSNMRIQPSFHTCKNMVSVTKLMIFFGTWFRSTKTGYFKVSIASMMWQA